MRRYAPIALLAALLVAVPLALVAHAELHKESATHVLLRVTPVDPHDLFRGEYVALSYPISQLEPHARAGATVYVPLHRAGAGWTGTHTVRRRPRHGTFVRGRAGGEFGVRILFGIEAFDVQEGTARRYEAAVGRQRLFADVALDSDGTARLDKLVIR